MIRFEASIATTSEAAMPGRTSRILPFSISTSALAKWPACRSIVSTTPPLSRMRGCDCKRASSGSAPWLTCADTVTGRAAPAANPAPAFRNARRDPAVSVRCLLMSTLPLCLLRLQHLACPLRQRGGRCHDPRDQHLDIFAADRVDLEAELPGVGGACLVPH